MSFTLLTLAAVAGVLVIAVCVFVLRSQAGKRKPDDARGQNVAAAFDGRQEVRVRWNGTGMTIEQMVWYGRQHGYDLYCLSGSGGSNRRLVMRRLPYAPPRQVMPGYGEQPHPAELAVIAKDVRRTVNPEAVWRLTGLLVVVAGVSGFAAYDRHQAGDSPVVPLAVATVLLLLALGLVIAARTALHRRRQRFAWGADPDRVPPPPRSNGAER